LSTTQPVKPGARRGKKMSLTPQPTILLRANLKIINRLRCLRASPELHLVWSRSNEKFKKYILKKRSL